MLAKLNDGFEIEIRDDCLDDWDFLELLDDVDNGNGGAIVRVARMLLGDEGVKALKEHLSADGKAKVSTMVTALTELMESVSALKNS